RARLQAPRNYRPTEQRRRGSVGRGELLKVFFFFSSRRRHTRLQGDWSSDVCSSDLVRKAAARLAGGERVEVEIPPPAPEELVPRSEERRVGGERTARWAGAAGGKA